MSYGQTVNLTGPTSVVEGRDAIFTCNVNGILFPTFVWNDVSVTPSQQIFVNFGSFSEKPKYDNFKLSQSGNSTIMTIREADFEDAGSFVCVASGVNSATIKFTIDGNSTSNQESFIIVMFYCIVIHELGVRWLEM